MIDFQATAATLGGEGTGLAGRRRAREGRRHARRRDGALRQPRLADSVAHARYASFRPAGGARRAEQRARGGRKGAGGSSTGGFSLGSILGAIQLSHSEAGGALVVSTSQQAVDAFTGSGTKLSGDATFQAAEQASGMPDQTTGFAYVDVKDALPLVQGLAALSGTGDSKVRPGSERAPHRSPRSAPARATASSSSPSPSKSDNFALVAHRPLADGRCRSAEPVIGSYSGAQAQASGLPLGGASAAAGAPLGS